MSIVMIKAEPMKTGEPFILQGNGRTYALDETAFNAAMNAAMAASGEVRIIGTGEAARILGLSRKTVQRILDDGRIPFRRNGEAGKRTMRESDVIAYRDAMRSNRSHSLAKLRDMAGDMGLYDLPDDE